MRTAASVTLSVVIVFMCFVALGQTNREPTAFEVASIRLDEDVRRSPTIGSAPGGQRFTATNMPLLWLISSAYDVSIRQLSGLPDSFNSKNYDIEATAAQPTGRGQMMRMLQGLLEDRFKLRTRRETKELSVYVLAVAKGGPKLTENKDGANLQARAGGDCQRSFRNFPMSLFANILSGDVAETVVDNTGLTQSYDFTLQFQPEQVGPGVKAGREAGCPGGLPSIFTALREQLGLELEKQRTPVEFLAIDHVEEPTEN